MGRSAAASASGGVHGFPAALTRFIGREGPVGEVAGRLEKSRLVTVTGPGGAGKTRLAGEVARRMADRFADGVWLAELAAVHDPDQVPVAVAAALGVPELPGVPAGEVLARALARQQALLVVDNCEHVIGAAAELCARLLSACDDVRVLATSREPLRVAGEARYRLAALTLPDPDDLADAARAEAVALFADRAGRADAHFELSAELTPAVARLVTRLDGLPLAIELAAARAETMGVAQLLDRLDDRFALLAAGDRLAAGRHRSLTATVEWSYLLLEEAERRVFRALSVFPAGFTLEGAEAVAGDGAGLAVLHMVDCSLLGPPRAGSDGRFRYAMLETLRVYAAGRLDEAGERGQARAALAGFAAGVAEQAAAGMQARTTEPAAARWLEAEDATIRQVLAWAAEHDTATALRLVAALGWWWLSRGQQASVYPLLQAAASRAEPGSDGWCTGQSWLGWTAAYSAEPARALDHFTALRDAVASRPPSRLLADALAGRAGILRSMGRTGEGIDDADRALAIARDLGYPAGELQALADLSLAALYGGDYGEAARLAGLAAQVTAGIPGPLARRCSFYLTVALIETGDLAGAERVSTAGLAWAREAGDLLNQTALLPRVVDLKLRAGQIDDAAARLHEALQLAVQAGNWIDLLGGLYQCGNLCAATGRQAEALTVWAANDRLARGEGFADPPWHVRRWEDQRRAAREALGPGEARVAEQRGAAMSQATAAEFALMLSAAEPRPPAARPELGPLSPRERELVTLVAQGRTNAQIAAQLFISIRTVGSHLDRIRDKTGCRRRTDLTRLALAAGLV